MVQKITVTELFDTYYHFPILDVRSPSEFLQGHIPNGVNFPLFSDEERIVVGTKYKQASPEKALLVGLDFVGKKLSQFVGKAKKIAPQKIVILYCARGGKRSSSMAWLLDLAGFDVYLLENGYKSYRNYILNYLDFSKYTFYVIGGRTGSGKTHILHQLSKQNKQIIDLEQIAHHKGSAFVNLGELNQPTNEQFENQLLTQLYFLQSEKEIFVENESRTIGKVAVPQNFWAKMKSSILIDLEIPFTYRLENILTDYRHFKTEDLVASFQKINKKLGNLQLKNAITLLEQSDITAAAVIALTYYDKLYLHSFENNPTLVIKKLNFDNNDFVKISNYLIQYTNQLFVSK